MCTSLIRDISIKISASFVQQGLAWEFFRHKWEAGGKPCNHYPQQIKIFKHITSFSVISVFLKQHHALFP